MTWPILLLTALNSMSTGVVSSGIFFLTKQGYGFSEFHNFALGAAGGTAYVAGALSCGPAVDLLRQRHGLSRRRILCATLILLTALCCLPLLLHSATGIWLFMLLYMPLNGALWPLVQSFVAGGRTGTELQQVLGRFNVSWSLAVALGYCGIAPLCKPAPDLAILALGALHALSIWPLTKLNAEPLPAPSVASVVPAHYASLLSTFRILLVCSAVLVTALSPFLPAALARLGIAVTWQTVVAAIWLFARALTFSFLSRAEHWRGRISMAWHCAVLMLAGFTLSVASSRFATGGLGLTLEVLGLLAYGVGMGQAYFGAIYYAQVVGRGAVAAGGKHEAFIGLGFAVGPVLGLLGTGIVELGWVPVQYQEWTIVLPTLALTAGLCLRALLAPAKPPVPVS